ncbi:MAG: AbrB/MazE/SpoVT family DNA-binding domain-containing protein [Oscillospiraceae bacterium]|nr:AbrB/MazE/SpoVT family DNA-binding domain-containing protein [Oscillospiraceae bacterium]
METTLQLDSRGGSAALRIPPKFLQQMNINEKSTVKIKISGDNELIISPVRQHKTLEERFKDWDGEYEIADEDREWLNAEEVGREK